jgi:hypothetical protein
MTDYPKQLTLEWLKEKSKPLYVRNITRPRGQIGVNFMNPNGRTKTIKIPRTHLPVCLTNQIGWDTILASDDLRMCIVRGVLDIVIPEVAEKELASEPAVIETERLQLSEFSAKQSFVSKRVQEMERAEATKVDPNAPGLEPLGIETNVIQPRIMSLVEKLRNQDIPIKAALSELKTMEGELRETDCSYILSNGPEGQIRNYVQKLLAQIRSTSAAKYDIRDDGEDEPVMTPEEQASESQREAIARQYQQV